MVFAIYRDPVPAPDVPEPVVPEPVPEPVVPEPVPEPVVPEPVPEPVVPEPVPEPVVPVSVPVVPEPLPEPVIPELPLPEPLLPEPLLPEPEVWASTYGAVTTSTARAANTFLLHLLNISLYSYNLEGCACFVARFEPYSPALHSAGEPCPGGQGAILMPEAHAGQRALSNTLRRHRTLLF